MFGSRIGVIGFSKLRNTDESKLLQNAGSISIDVVYNTVNVNNYLLGSVKGYEFTPLVMFPNTDIENIYALDTTYCSYTTFDKCVIDSSDVGLYSEVGDLVLLSIDKLGVVELGLEDDSFSFSIQDVSITASVESGNSFRIRDDIMFRDKHLWDIHLGSLEIIENQAALDKLLQFCELCCTEYLRLRGCIRKSEGADFNLLRSYMYTLRIIRGNMKDVSVFNNIVSKLNTKVSYIVAYVYQDMLVEWDEMDNLYMSDNTVCFTNRVFNFKKKRLRICNNYGTLYHRFLNSNNGQEQFSQPDVVMLKGYKFKCKDKFYFYIIDSYDIEVTPDSVAEAALLALVERNENMYKGDVK